MTAVTITLLATLTPLGLTAIAYVSAQLAALRAEIDALKANHAALKAEVADLRKDVNDIRNEVNDIKQTLAKIEGQMEILIADSAAIKANTSSQPS